MATVRLTAAIKTTTTVQPGKKPKLYGDAEQPAGADGVFIGDTNRVSAIEVEEHVPGQRQTFLGGSGRRSGQ